jgi:hypothetical protein
MKKDAEGSGVIHYIFNKADVDRLGHDASILRECERRRADGTLSRPNHTDPETVTYKLTFNSGNPLDKNKLEMVDKIIADRGIVIEA